MANSDTHQKLHAIFIPYPLQGLVIPSIHLAIQLASRGFTITFINTHSLHHQTAKAQPNTASVYSTNEDIFSTIYQLGLDIHYTIVSDSLPLDFNSSFNHDWFMAALLHVFSAYVEEVVGKMVSSA
jgi:hypothetical protein